VGNPIVAISFSTLVPYDASTIMDTSTILGNRDDEIFPLEVNPKFLPNFHNNPKSYSFLYNKRSSCLPTILLLSHNSLHNLPITQIIKKHRIHTSLSIPTIPPILLPPSNVMAFNSNQGGP